MPNDLQTRRYERGVMGDQFDKHFDFTQLWYECVTAVVKCEREKVEVCFIIVLYNQWFTGLFVPTRHG